MLALASCGRRDEERELDGSCFVVGWRGSSYVPPIGGKRMERRQRKQSVPHIMKVAVDELNLVLG